MWRVIEARLGVLVSGGGTNLQAILDAARDPGYPARVVAVISDRDGVQALERAVAAGADAATVRLEDFPDRESFTRAVMDELEKRQVGIVATAGYMKLLSPSMFERYAGRILNTHPSLLPSFPGYARKVLRETLASGVKVSGATIHFLDEGTDTGPIVFQECVRVEYGDTAESLHARIQDVEHRLLPEAIRLLAEERLSVEGRRVRIHSPR